MSAESIATIERLLAEAERLPDPQARGLVKALAAALVDLVGDGMRRVIEHGESAGDTALLRKLADDDVVGNLLVLCGLHPDAAHVRAEHALRTATKELASIDVELDGVEAMGSSLRVRLRDTGRAKSDRARSMVEAIVVARAPDIDAIHVELDAKPIQDASFVSVERLRVIT